MSGVFTLDAIVAVTLASVILSASVMLFVEPKRAGNKYLYQVSTDVLTILDENGGLILLAGGDSSKLNEIKTALPQKFCIDMRVYNSSNMLVSFEDGDCGTSGDYAISRRSFVNNQVFYVAEAKVWLR